MTLPEMNPHPLKKEIQSRGIRLWQISQALGGSPCESLLSRQLNGIRPMPKEVEDDIRKLVGVSE